MLGSIVPIYNYLIDQLEEYYEKYKNCDNNYKEILDAIQVGTNKLKEYYSRTDDSAIYTIATG